MVNVEFRIREAREQAGYSQKELAQIIGVAQNTFHGYESGKHDPKSDLLIKIAKACNVTVDFLLGQGDFVGKKLPPAQLKPNPGGDVIKLLEVLDATLVNMGYIGEEEDLTEQQGGILIGICQILCATFKKK